MTRRRLERHELHRAAPRRHRGRALEPPAPDRGAARGRSSSSASTGARARSVAATDYIRTFAGRHPRRSCPAPYRVLGTDGFGRSDYRVALRRFFEVDRHHVAVAALQALAEQGTVEPAVVQEAIERYEIDPDAEAPDGCR